MQDFVRGLMVIGFQKLLQALFTQLLRRFYVAFGVDPGFSYREVVGKKEGEVDDEYNYPRF